jgi:hypothetical protein
MPQPAGFGLVDFSRWPVFGWSPWTLVCRVYLAAPLLIRKFCAKNILIHSHGYKQWPLSIRYSYLSVEPVNLSQLVARVSTFC